MRQHICKSCGKIYLSDNCENVLCPACAEKSKKNVFREKTCAVCGASFIGYPRSKYCAQCRPIVQRELNRKHKKEGTQRKIGSIDLCVNCGKPYTVNSGRQRYCSTCAKTVVPDNVRAQTRAWTRAHVDKKEKMENRKGYRACAICGRAFHPSVPTTTCSPECAAELKRRRQAIYDVRRGRANPERILGKKQHTAPQSGIPGITWHKGKWQVKYKGKYGGVFTTIDEAYVRLVQMKKDKEGENAT